MSPGPGRTWVSGEELRLSRSMRTDSGKTSGHGFQDLAVGLPPLEDWRTSSAATLIDPEPIALRGLHQDLPDGYVQNLLFEKKLNSSLCTFRQEELLELILT